MPPIEKPSYAAEPKIARSTPRGLILKTYRCGVPGRISTSGSLRDFSKAWVYVAQCEDGLTKIGMSSNLPQRMSQLRARLCFAQPVLPAFARTIETVALRYLGVRKGGSEFVECSAEAAADAVRKAVEELGKVRKVVPDMDEAA